MVRNHPRSTKDRLSSAIRYDLLRESTVSVTRIHRAPRKSTDLEPIHERPHSESKPDNTLAALAIDGEVLHETILQLPRRPRHLPIVIHRDPERVALYSDPSERRELVLSPPEVKWVEGYQVMRLLDAPIPKLRGVAGEGGARDL